MKEKLKPVDFTEIDLEAGKNWLAPPSAEELAAWREQVRHKNRERWLLEQGFQSAKPKAAQEKAYDESQHPRDEHGRWTDAGGDEPDDEPEPVSPIPIEEGPAASHASTQFMAEVESTIKSVPNAVQKKMADAGIKIKTGIMVTDLYPELKGEHPRGWPRGMTWDHVEALHYPKDKAIVITEMKKLVGGKLTPNTRVQGALLHETGHAWDQTLDKPSSFSPAFTSAYADDVKQLTKEERGKLRYYLQKGQAGRSEAFAEIFAWHIGKGAASSDIREFFPNASRWVKYSMDMGGAWKQV